MRLVAFDCCMYLGKMENTKERSRNKNQGLKFRGNEGSNKK